MGQRPDGPLRKHIVASPASAATFDYTSRAEVDRLLATFEARGAIGQADDNNELGDLARGQAYVLLGLVRMYESTKDTTYLDHLIRNIDSVLSQRDQVRADRPCQ
jgi:rhamnogalacturonyl hydrolase YesR